MKTPVDIFKKAKLKHDLEKREKKDKENWTHFIWAADILEIRKNLGYPVKGVVLDNPRPD